MIRRKTSKKSGSKNTLNKYKIVMKFTFGPFANAASAVAMRKLLKSKVAKVRFSGSPSAGNGFRFVGEVAYIKRVAATASALKQTLVNSAPNAKITVTKM